MGGFFNYHIPDRSFIAIMYMLLIQDMAMHHIGNISRMAKSSAYHPGVLKGFLRRFQQLRSYRDEIETRNREEIPYTFFE